MANPDRDQEEPSSESSDNDTVSNVKSLDTERGKRWESLLVRAGAKGGPPKKIMLNGMIALQHAPAWKNVLKYDASALMVVLEKAPPWEAHKGPWKERPWNDQDDRLFTSWLQQCRIDLSIGVAAEAVQAVARKRTFHPIRDYLDSLKWDGVPRIENWLVNYLGAADTPYHKAIGPRYLTAGVARIYRPACKADAMLILEGRQGAGKSTALKILGGEWFTDEVGELGSKDAAMTIAGRWIVEFGELEEFKGASLERLKAFLSRTIDRFRPPYGRSVVDSPRQCIFAGTTNPEEYLHDSTGNRRFWPVRCGQIDTAGLIRDRDQLWAEAKALFEQGALWWLDTPDLQKLAAEAQEERFMLDPWEEPIAAYLKSREDREITISGLLSEVFDIEESDSSRREQHRVGGILRRLNWERIQVRVNDVQIRKFRKKKD